MSKDPGSSELGLLEDANVLSPQRAPRERVVTKIQRYLPRIGLIFALMALAFMPSLVAGFWLRLLTGVLYLSIAVAGLNLSFGLLGQISVGHGAFVAIGAYSVALIGQGNNLNLLVALCVGSVAGGIAGALLGLPAVRTTGKYFAMVTLAFASIVFALTGRWTSVTGGPAGIRDFGSAPIIPGLERHVGFYYICLVVASAIWLFSSRVIRGRWGHTLVGIRDAEPAVLNLGVHSYWWKVSALSLSGALGGLAGTLVAYRDGVVQPESFSLHLSIILLAAVLVGGKATGKGPFIGALVLVLVPELFASLFQYTFLVLGTILLLMGGYARRGIAGWLESLSETMVTRGDVARDRDEDLTGDDEDLTGDLDDFRNSTGAPGGSRESQSSVTRERRKADGEQPLVSVEGITRDFGGVRALNNVSLQIFSGERMGLIGGNGSGKTTLVNIISGLDGPTSGAVRVNGRDVTGLSAHNRAGVVRTFQHVKLAEELSATQNVRLGFHRGVEHGGLSGILGLPRATAEARRHQIAAKKLLDYLGVATFDEMPVGSLPYGSQRLVELARAMAAAPRVLFLDEPAAGLGKREIPNVRRAIRLIASRGVAIVLIDHHVDLVVDLCDRLVVLDSGNIIADGSTSDVIQDRAVQEAYLGGVLDVAGDITA